MSLKAPLNLKVSPPIVHPILCPRSGPSGHPPLALSRMGSQVFLMGRLKGHLKGSGGAPSMRFSPRRQPNRSGGACVLKKSEKESQALAIFRRKDQSQGFLGGGGGGIPWGPKTRCNPFTCVRKSQSQKNRDTWRIFVRARGPPKLEPRSVQPNEVFENFACRICPEYITETWTRQKCSRKECSSKRPHENEEMKVAFSLSNLLVCTVC